MIKEIKLWLFKKRWYWKHRHWEDCRHKRRAFEREYWDYMEALRRRMG